MRPHRTLGTSAMFGWSFRGRGMCSPFEKATHKLRVVRVGGVGKWMGYDFVRAVILRISPNRVLIDSPSHQKQAELVVVEIAAEPFFGLLKSSNFRQHGAA